MPRVYFPGRETRAFVIFEPETKRFMAHRLSYFDQFRLSMLSFLGMTVLAILTNKVTDGTAPRWVYVLYVVVVLVVFFIEARRTSDALDKEQAADEQFDRVDDTTQKTHKNVEKLLENAFKRVPPEKWLTDSVAPPHPFFGRINELADIRKALEEGRTAVLVNGIGGIGKTSLAARFAAERADFYSRVAWLTVSSSIGSAIVGKLAEPLGLYERVRELDPKSYETEGAAMVLRALKNLEGQKLLILDNANDADDLLHWRNRLQSAGCHVLVTSRATLDGWDPIRVDELSVDEARALFRKHAKLDETQADDATIDRILQKIERHTLLTELLAKSAEKSRISLAELENRLANTDFLSDEALSRRAIDTGQHGQSVEDRAKQAKLDAYLDFIFEEMTVLPEGQKNALRAFALLPPAIFFEEAFLEKNLFGTLGLPFQLDDIERLVQAGWLVGPGQGASVVQYAMHPLVGRLVFRKLGVGLDFALPFIGFVGKAVNYDSLDPQSDLFEKREKQRLAEHLALRFEKGKAGKLSYLLNGLAILEKNFGEYAAAKNHFRKALDMNIALHGEAHSEVAASQSNLAGVLHDLGELAEARDLLRAALSSDLSNFGENHPRVALRRSNLAMVLKDLGELAEARDLMRAALSSDLSNFGESHPKVAVSRSNLAIVLQDLGELAEARDLLRAALSSDLSNFGESHPVVAVSRSNLGLVLQDLGELAEARDLMRAALSSDLSNFSENHPVVAALRSNLAIVLQDLGELEEARELLQVALNSKQNLFGKNHPTIGITLVNLAVVERQLGEKATARERMLAAQHIFLKNFGPEHPHSKITADWLRRWEQEG